MRIAHPLCFFVWLCLLMPQFPSALSAFKSRTRRTFSPHLPDPISPMCKRMYFREICFFSSLLVARAISPLFLSTLSLHSLSPLSLSLHRLSRSPGCSRDHYSCSKLHRATRLHSGSITALDTSSTTHRLRCCQSGCAVPLPCRKRSWRKSLSLLDLEALQGQGVRLGLWATTLGIQINAGWEMNAGLIILRVESESESGGCSSSSLAVAAPLQQLLRRSSSSVAAALQPGTRMVVSSPRPSSRCCSSSRYCWQHLEEGDAARQQHLEEGREMLQHALRRSCSSSVAAAAAAGDGRAPRRFAVDVFLYV